TICNIRVAISRRVVPLNSTAVPPCPPHTGESTNRRVGNERNFACSPIHRLADSPDYPAGWKRDGQRAFTRRRYSTFMRRVKYPGCQLPTANGNLLRLKGLEYLVEFRQRAQRGKALVAHGITVKVGRFRVALQPLGTLLESGPQSFEGLSGL